MNMCHTKIASGFRIRIHAIPVCDARSLRCLTINKQNKKQNKKQTQKTKQNEQTTTTTSKNNNNNKTKTNKQTKTRNTLEILSTVFD